MSKTIRSNYLISLLPEEVRKRTNNRLTKKLDNEMSIVGFEKLQYILESLEGHVHAQCYMHAQEGPEKALNSHL